MASGLKCIHEAGIINRDVKGENFIFAVEPSKAAKAGQPLVIKFIDLGMATEYSPKDPIRGAFTATHYRSAGTLLLLLLHVDRQWGPRNCCLAARLLVRFSNSPGSEADGCDQPASWSR